MAKKCKECGTYGVVLIADKSQPSQYMSVMSQSDSDQINRWTISFPVEETDYCYYCTKRKNGQIAAPSSYGNSYYDQRNK